MPTRRTPIDRIVSKLTAHFEIAVEDLDVQTGTKKAGPARLMGVFFLARAGYNNQEIAKIFNYKSASAFDDKLAKYEHAFSSGSGQLYEAIVRFANQQGLRHLIRS